MPADAGIQVALPLPYGQLLQFIPGNLGFVTVIIQGGVIFQENTQTWSDILIEAHKQIEAVLDVIALPHVLAQAQVAAEIAEDLPVLTHHQV